MENSNKTFNEILSKLQETLNSFKCKSEVRLSENEAILYGKLSHYMEKYTIVIHLKEQDYEPVTLGAGKIDIRDDDSQKFTMPSLDFQSFRSQQSNCSREEQQDLKNKFMQEAEIIGKEFLRQVNKP